MINGFDESIEVGSGVHISPEDRQKHIHIIGASGKGKSKLLEQLIRHDLNNPDVGACVIDPHGLLIHDILGYVSHVRPSLAKRIVLFSPATQTENVVGFNPIPKGIGDPATTVQTFISNVLKAWGADDPTKFPGIRTWLYNIFYPIVQNNLTISECSPLINIHDKDHRLKYMEYIDDPEVRADWEDFQKLSNQQKMRLIEGAANRLRRFIRTDEMRLIFSQQSSSIDFADIIENKKILLVSLHGAGRIHDDDLSLLGVLLLSELFRVGMLRDAFDPTIPKFHLYIDEFGSYVTESVAKMLDQIRKKKIFVTLAHQHLSQLQNEEVGRRVMDSIMTNCRVKFAFGGMGWEDADAMTHQIWPGHIDFHEIHSQQPRYRTVTHEERRDVVTNGQSEGQTLSKTKSLTTVEGAAEGIVESEALSEGEAEALANSKMKSSSSAQTDASTESQSQSTGKTKAIGWGEGEGSAESSGGGSSRTTNQGEATQFRVEADGTITPITSLNTSVSSGSNEFTAQAHNKSKFRSESEAVTSADVRGASTSRAVQYAISDGETESSSQTKSRTVSEAVANSRTKNRSKSDGIAEAIGETRSFSQSVASVPYDRKEEIVDYEPRFYNHNEQMFRKMGEMMTLPIGETIMQVDGDKPIRLKTVHVPSIKWLKRASPRQIDRIVDRIATRNASYYASRVEVEKETELRQIKFFSAPLRSSAEEYEPLVENAEEEAEKPDGEVYNF